MTKSEKRKRLSLIVERLKELYPTAECALHYGGDPWKLHASTYLNQARWTDEPDAGNGGRGKPLPYGGDGGREEAIEWV